MRSTLKFLDANQGSSCQIKPWTSPTNHDPYLSPAPLGALAEVSRSGSLLWVTP